MNFLFSLQATVDRWKEFFYIVLKLAVLYFAILILLCLVIHILIIKGWSRLFCIICYISLNRGDRPLIWIIFYILFYLSHLILWHIKFRYQFFEVRMMGGYINPSLWSIMSSSHVFTNSESRKPDFFPYKIFSLFWSVLSGFSCLAHYIF